MLLQDLRKKWNYIPFVGVNGCVRANGLVRANGRSPLLHKVIMRKSCSIPVFRSEILFLFVKGTSPLKCCDRT
ncbi:MAG: hypothetical protein F6K17_33275 [Okeania sp. SIO3C4]|nr:hypothetical protein [Okeania sp. SIO3B3]NER07107.1 hypothetical protein [Okeania sp. SIO3C4]